MLHLAGIATTQPAACSEDSTTVGAASVRWRRDGNGPAVVFLHGFPLSGRTWDKVVSRLRDLYTCHTLDLIGLGQSHSTAGDDYSSQGQARAFQGLLAQRGVESYALVGNDTGGWIARELALIDTPRVSRLVLTNTEIPFHRPPWIPTYQLLAHVPGFGTVIQQPLGFRAFRRSSLAFGGCFHDPTRLDGEFHEQFVEPLIGAAARIEEAMRFLRRMKFFIWGVDDPTFPASRAREMSRRFPNVAGFHEVPNAKLFVHEEHPEEVAGIIDRFLSVTAT